LKGVIVDTGEKFYTDMQKVLNSINNHQLDYNWLITDYWFISSEDSLEDRESRRS